MAEVPLLETLGEAENYLNPDFGNRDVAQALTKLSGTSTRKGFATQPPRANIASILKDGVITISRTC